MVLISFTLKNTTHPAPREKETAYLGLLWVILHFFPTWMTSPSINRILPRTVETSNAASSSGVVLLPIGGISPAPNAESRFWMPGARADFGCIMQSITHEA